MSSTFKEKEVKVKKNLKKCYSNLLSYHSAKLEEFNDEASKLKNLKSKYDTLNDKCNKISSKKLKTIEEFKQISELKDEIEIVGTIITKIENNENTMEYFFDTSEILEEYCNLESVPIKSKLTMMNFFNVQKKTDKFNKKDLLDKYLDIVDQNHVEIVIEQNFNFCKDCNKEMILRKQQGMFICVDCGRTYIIPVDLENHKGPNSSSETMKYSVYQRKNHFREWLNQIQAKESTDIPTEVFDMILIELNKMRIYNLADLDANIIQKILKKLNLSKYYENTFHIMYRLNGLQPPTLSREMEEKLLTYFKQIEEPFKLYKKKNRKNILRYSYILYKLCELLELDDFLPCFKLLKNRNKLMEQDVIWQSICNHLNWEFISSL